MVQAATLESAMVRLKKLVYKNRIRVKDFLADFDKLKSGYVHPNHFLTALSMAGIDKHLTPAELEVICEAYKTQRSPSLTMVEYRPFINDVDMIFTIPHLEKNPLVDVASEPDELLDKTRYLKSSRMLGGDKEDQVQACIERLTEIVNKRGTPVKPFFDDAAADDHSAKLYGHVTIPQFRQCLSTKLELLVTETEAALLVEKFHHEDKPEFVNYIAFSNTIDPPEKYWAV